MPAALTGLTTRGRSFLAAGGAAAACAVLLGQRDLLRVAVLLVALPLASVLLVARARHRIQLSRTVSPARVPAGRTASVRLELANLARLPTGVLLAEDHVPYVLGSRPRFVVDRLDAGASVAVTYSLSSDVRGRWDVGPLRLRVTDPFGMCEVARSFSATDPLVVVPRVHPLLPLRGTGSWSGSGESSTTTAAAAGDHDVATREYRDGDDLRRVHWRSTARRGELMVRRDEQPHLLRATIVLDRRAVGHRGDGPASSFEWAVSAAASVATLLAESGYGVRVLTDDVEAPWTGRDAQHGVGALMDRLATLQPGGPHDLREAHRALTRTGGDGLVVGILGEVDTADVQPVAALPRRGAAGLAFLLHTTSWVSSLPPRRRAEIDEARRRSALTLDRAGWGVVTPNATTTIPDGWRLLVERQATRAGGGAGARAGAALPGATG
ncbi:MAG: DUF58 domain-containing protein [Actinomycetes bacterium]